MRRFGDFGWRASGAGALVAEVLLVLLVLCAAELGLRAYVNATPTIGPPRVLDSSVASGKYVAFQRSAAQRERTDVLLLGLSPMIRMSARQLAADLSQPGREVTAFNFAFPLHSIAYDQSLVRDIILRDQNPPRLIVYGIMPLNLLNESRFQRTEERVRRLPAFRFHESTPGGRVRALVLARLELFLYRDVVREFLLGEKRKFDPWAARARTFDDRGDVEPTALRTSRQKRLVWEKVAYQTRMQKFATFMKDGSLAERLEEFVGFCRQRGIGLLIVNTAVSPEFLELLPDGRSNYDEFVDLVANIAARNDTPFLDLSGPDLGSAEEFTDSHHLDFPAALQATHRIAAFASAQGLFD